MPFSKKNIPTRISIFCLLLLIVLIAVCDFVFFISTQQYFAAVAGMLACLSLHLMPVYLFKKNIRLYFIFLVPIYILLPLNLASIILFDVPINDATILLILNTNFKESLELIKGYIPAFVLATLVYIAFLYWLIVKIPNRMPEKPMKIISFSALVIFMLLPFIDIDEPNYFLKLRTRFYTVFPTSFLYASKAVYKQYRLINDSKSEREHFVFHAKQDTSITEKQIYVLIIGESSRYESWGLNGYLRNTSPRLSKRENLLSFSEATSGGFITEFAVPLIVTGVGADKFDSHTKQKGIVGAFKEAGFTTYWITNQVDEGHIKIHCDEADKKYIYQSDYRATKNVHGDGELVQTLKSVLAESGQKKFIVMHTTGSHYDYSVRYPDNYDIFKPSNKTVFSRSADKAFKDVLVNSYDNSTLYADTVIDSVISLVAKNNTCASVTYLSDHGENLFDDKRNLSQHAYPIPSKYIAHIPFFVWYSPVLEKYFPQKIANLKTHINASISSENIMNTLTSMSGISYPSQDVQKNIASPYFKNNAQLILGANNKVYPYNSLK